MRAAGPPVPPDREPGSRPCAGRYEPVANQLPPDVHAWLTANGWHPSRGIGRVALDAIAHRRRQLDAQGYPFSYEPPTTIEPFLRGYGLLDLPHPGAPEVVFRLDPRIAYEHDAEAFAALRGGGASADAEDFFRAGRAGRRHPA